MRVFLVEANPEDVGTLMDQWVFRRATVAAISEEAAVQCVRRGLQGGAVFTGYQDEGLHCRLGEEGYFDPHTATVTYFADEPDGIPINKLRSRIISWELCPPEDDQSEPEDSDLAM